MANNTIHNTPQSITKERKTRTTTILIQESLYKYVKDNKLKFVDLLYTGAKKHGYQNPNKTYPK